MIQRMSHSTVWVLDQDRALSDQGKPFAYLPQYDSGDHVLPNDAGYQAIAAAMPLDIFTQATPLAPANPATDCSTGVTPGQTLTSIQSCDGRFALAFLSNGDMTVTQTDAQGSHLLWSAGTSNLGAVQAVMLQTGNLVLNDANGRTVWATNTDFGPVANLLMQNDGNLVLYNLRKPVWSTGTCCH